MTSDPPSPVDGVRRASNPISYSRVPDPLLKGTKSLSVHMHKELVFAFGPRFRSEQAVEVAWLKVSGRKDILRQLPFTLENFVQN